MPTVAEAEEVKKSLRQGPVDVELFYDFPPGSKVVVDEPIPFKERFPGYEPTKSGHIWCNDEEISES